jgi:hypothetical protein
LCTDDDDDDEPILKFDWLIGFYNIFTASCEMNSD